MTDDDHRALADVLHGVEGKVALSGYRCTLMDELYSDWHCIEAAPKMCHSVKQLRSEAIWINYNPPATSSWKPHKTSLR